MGKLIFTPIQQLVFDEFSKDEKLRKMFYFTGGTALSVFYFQHRYSDDLDFFSENDFEDTGVNLFIDKLSSILKRKHKFTRVEGTRIFEFDKGGKLVIKVDFGYYPYKRLQEGKKHKGVRIDSLLDIGANKIMTINQRSSSKDYVDLYFLLKKYTLWDLMYAVEKKFRREIDVMLMAGDLYSALELDMLPRMIKPLKLTDLQKFFTQKSREVAGKVVEE